MLRISTLTLASQTQRLEKQHEPLSQASVYSCPPSPVNPPGHHSSVCSRCLFSPFTQSLTPIHMSAIGYPLLQPHGFLSSGLYHSLPGYIFLNVLSCFQLSSNGISHTGLLPRPPANLLCHCHSSFLCIPSSI